MCFGLLRSEANGGAIARDCLIAPPQLLECDTKVGIKRRFSGVYPDRLTDQADRHIRMSLLMRNDPQ